MTRWNLDPAYLRLAPFSPVHSARKFSAVFGTRSLYSEKTTRPTCPYEYMGREKQNKVRSSSVQELCLRLIIEAAPSKQVKATQSCQVEMLTALPPMEMSKYVRGRSCAIARSSGRGEERNSQRRIEFSRNQALSMLMPRRFVLSHHCFRPPFCFR